MIGEDRCIRPKGRPPAPETQLRQQFHSRQLQRQLEAKIHVLAAEELDVELDEHGLPLDAKHSYSRWLYGDFGCFQVGSSKLKRREQEIQPRVFNHMVTQNTNIGEQFSYLTDGLDT
jgi:hypothetical protein